MLKMVVGFRQKIEERDDDTKLNLSVFVAQIKTLLSHTNSTNQNRTNQNKRKITRKTRTKKKKNLPKKHIHCKWVSGQEDKLLGW